MSPDFNSIIETALQDGCSVMPANPIADPQLTLGLVATWYQSNARSVMTVKQAASYLAVSADFIYDLCRSGELQHQRLRRNIRIRKSDLDSLCVNDASTDDGW